jgi:hypothetical protein
MFELSPGRPHRDDARGAISRRSDGVALMLVRGAASFRRAKSRPLKRAHAPLLPTDYQAGLASLRTDNQRHRRQDPRPRKSGPPARSREPTRRSAPNTAEPIGYPLARTTESPMLVAGRRCCPEPLPFHTRTITGLHRPSWPQWIGMSGHRSLRASYSARANPELRNLGLLRRSGSTPSP